MTRIIAGLARGLPLSVPAKGTRPTSDRVREALFSALESRDLVDGARVLDLYAGSGALGLEAASRGAASAVLVERHAAAAGIARANAAKLRAAGADAEVSVVTRDARSWLERHAGPAFDLVFIDPPYELGNDALVGDLASLAPLLAPEAVVVVERSTREAEPRWPDGYALDRRSGYGETVLYWLTRSEMGVRG